MERKAMTNKSRLKWIALALEGMSGPLILSGILLLLAVLLLPT